MDASFFKWVLPKPLGEANSFAQLEAALDAMVEQSPHAKLGINVSGILNARLIQAVLVIFDGLVTPHYIYVFKRYMLRIFGFQRFSYICLLDKEYFPKCGVQREVYTITPRLEVHDAASLLIKSIAPEHKVLHTEDKKTAHDIAEVCN